MSAYVFRLVRACFVALETGPARDAGVIRGQSLIELLGRIAVAAVPALMEEGAPPLLSAAIARSFGRERMEGTFVVCLGLACAVTTPRHTGPSRLRKIV